MTVAAAAVRKFHVSLNVSNLERSIAFYGVPLGRAAAKQQADYGRVEEAGFPTTREEDVECCYARQTKFWISDPDRVSWEVYVFHEDINEHGAGSVPDLDRSAAFTKDVARPRVVWEHRIPEVFPSPLPYAENRLDETRLEGTINLSLESAALARIVEEAFRLLRPGGLLRIHGLAGDRPLTVPLPVLPGPASVVQYLLDALEPMRAMVEAGLVEIRFEKLSRTAHFTIAGVEMREIVLTGHKPGYRLKKLTHQAVYRGPLAEVTDDFGNTFGRGERVSLNIHDWRMLSRSPVPQQFQFFSPDSLVVVQESCCASDTD